MKREELVAALKQIGPETGSLCCLGCGYEHGCSVHGCAVIKAAVAVIEAAPLPPPPLTLEELREMDGDKIFICYIEACKGFYEDEEVPYYGKFEQYIHENNDMLHACALPLRCYGKTWLAYRRKPEEGAIWQQ